MPTIKNTKNQTTQKPTKTMMWYAGRESVNVKEVKVWKRVALIIVQKTIQKIVQKNRKNIVEIVLVLSIEKMVVINENVKEADIVRLNTTAKDRHKENATNIALVKNAKYQANEARTRII